MVHNELTAKLIDRQVMTDSSLSFELITILAITAIGSGLLLVGLPGWGLITTAFLLASMTIGLRLPAIKHQYRELALIRVKGE